MPSWIDYLLRYGAPDPDAAAAQADVPSGDLLAHIAGGLAKKGADTVQSAVTAPRDAYTGDLQVFDPTTGHVSDEAMHRANEMAGLAMTGSLPFEAPQGALRMFGGRNAATADHAALAQAQKLAETGADRKAIWDQTGWFKGADDKWRFEIPDNASAVNPDALTRRDVSIGGRTIPHREGTASNVLMHPELYAAYPDAANMVVGQTNYGGGSIARYLEGNNYSPEMIGVEGGSIGPSMQRPMLHEMQHAIQQREGFARGGNPDAMGGSVPNPKFAAYQQAEGVDPHLMELQSKLKSKDYQAEIAASNDLFAKQYEPRMDALEASVTGRNGYAKIQPELDAIMREYDAHSKSTFPTLTRVDELGRLLDARGIPTRKPSPTLSPDQAYRSLAGEVEARNVETRRDFTPEQRRATPPWETQGVPDAQQIVRMGGDGPQMAIDPIRAYHGSPHDFDRFDLSKLGTGEGAQAYGHGLYFAGNEDVARIYRDALSPKLYSHPELGAGLTEADVSRHLSGAGQALGMTPGSLLNETVQNAVNRLPKDRRGQLDYLIGEESHPQARQVLEQSRSFVPDRAGRMYEVAIDADPAKMLDWDKPLAVQGDVGERVSSLLNARGIKAPKLSETDQLMADLMGADWQHGGAGAYKALASSSGPAAAAQALREAGIPGLQYLDGGSRLKGDGSRNYVTFSDDIVKILRKYGLAGLAALGAGQGAVQNLGMGAPSQGMSN